MHQCHQCGNMFEGNFCPHCGEKWTPERFCPHCGGAVDLDDSYCPACGCALPPAAEGMRPAEPAGEKSGAEKLAAAVRLVPAVLLALLSLLLYFFCLAPMAVVPKSQTMGQGVQSYGNVYAFLSAEYSGGVFTGYARTFVAFTVILTVLSAGVCVLRFLPKAPDPKWTIAGKELSLSGILTGAGYLFVAILFIVACAATGSIPHAAGGFYLVAAGAAPVLVLVFCLLFSLAAAGAAVFRYLLITKYGVASK